MKSNRLILWGEPRGQSRLHFVSILLGTVVLLDEAQVLHTAHATVSAAIGTSVVVIILHG